MGKTHVAAAIVRTLVTAGRRVGVYKPVASGCTTAADIASDAWQLWDAAGRPLTPEDVCPQVFAAPIAPHRSSRHAGREVDERLLRTGLDAWFSAADVVVVEGAGGLFSPVGAATLVSDLARDFRLPLVIVDAARLGAVGRSLATCRAAEAEGLEVAAVVLSHTTPPTGVVADPASAVAIARDSAADIASRLPTIPVAILEHAASRMPPGIDWAAIARC
ncbi:MAG: dethiobiotin synthase [Planctomycetia bacterium]|nr:dethiobiotin synthase [Planctomycetia bacterium]